MVSQVVQVPELLTQFRQPTIGELTLHMQVPAERVQPLHVAQEVQVTVLASGASQVMHPTILVAHETHPQVCQL